jgi:methyl acetate hydrolase
MSIDTDALARLVEEFTTRETSPIPRLVVSVANRDGVVFEKAQGIKNFADPPGKDNRVSMDSLFWFASQTKLITSLAAAICIERGLFTLDSLAEDFVPELKTIQVLEGFDEQDNEILREPKSRITIRHLVTHTAGSVVPLTHVSR